jgi:hypothetical protein
MCQPVHTTSPQPQPAAPAAPKGTLLPVYYLGPGQRLYREFHPGTNASTVERTRAALTLMLDPHSPYDPDYTSDWPVAAAVRDVRLSDDTVTVDLTGVTTAPDRAVQQLVWTATAASGATAVRLLSDGVPVTSFGGIADKAGLLHRDRAVDVLGLVWLIDPQQGATVGRTVRVQLYGSVFEATVHLRVRQGGSTVTEQAVTLSAGQPAFGEAITSVTLAPGRYTIEAYAVSAKDGSPQYLDDHDITVS